VKSVSGGSIADQAQNSNTKGVTSGLVLAQSYDCILLESWAISIIVLVLGKWNKS
jgi:hypothetical protein